MTSCRHVHANGRPCDGQLTPAERGAGYRYCLAHRDQSERLACVSCRGMLDTFRPAKGWNRDQAAQLRAGRAS
jgi:hypothetical protein